MRIHLGYFKKFTIAWLPYQPLMGEQDDGTAVFWRGLLSGLQAVGFLYSHVEEKECGFIGISLRSLTPCMRAPPP